jgi:Rod binding domain-containing protein
MPIASPLSAAADKLLKKQGATDDKGKVEKSAKDFESILLGSWLQQAESSFAKVPGGDDDEDQDAGSEQMQGIAMQSLGSAMAAGGGIGIARMIVARLSAENTPPPRN